MMYWYDHGVSGWGWFAMAVSMILFLALITIAAILLFRALGRTQEHTRTPAAPTPATPTPATPTPEQLLAERFARGEIDGKEYQERLATLQAAAGGPRPKA